jgi:hypothetical protein
MKKGRLRGKGKSRVGRKEGKEKKKKKEKWGKVREGGK